MGMQSFRGAGGGGAISLRSARAHEAAAEYELSPVTHELLTAVEDHAQTVLVRASTVAAVVTFALVATWLVAG